MTNKKSLTLNLSHREMSVVKHYTAMFGISKQEAIKYIFMSYLDKHILPTTTLTLTPKN